MSDQGNSTSSPSPPSGGGGGGGGGGSTPTTGNSPSPPLNEQSPPSNEQSPPSNEQSPPSSSSSSSSPPPPPPSRDQTPPPPPSQSSRTYDNPPTRNIAPPPAPTKSNSGSSNNGNARPPPPPQSSKAIPPPDSKGTPSPTSSFFSNEKAIIGTAAAGSGLILIIMLVCIICCCAKRRKRRRHEKMQQYYRDHSHGNISRDYNLSANWNHSTQQHSHEMRMPPTGQVSSEYTWPIQPPPPPPMMTSAEFGSTNFSGLHSQQMPPRMSMGFNQSTFTYDDLASATGGFAITNLLGQGGFGYVHKGVLPNGKEVAVKSLKANSGQGEREFQAEVDIISRVHHRHLVSLVGYCIAGAQRMLVYEFVENDTLENRLHGKGMPTMDWSTRLRIALGSAKGFAYLHEDCHPRIIHRDIKASNILLDDRFEAKVADFGLAKLSSDTNTHVSTRIMGTFGYLAPEYASSGKLTEKSDIYSYGVVLLELITGKLPVDIHSDDDSLVDWARPILSSILEGDQSYEEIADPLLEGNYDPQEMLRMIACAAACIRHSARKRPKMSQIVRALEGDASLDDLNEVVKSSPSSSAFGSSNSLTELELKKHKKTGVSSRDFSSGEHMTTRELPLPRKSGGDGTTGELPRKSGGESQEI